MRLTSDMLIPTDVSQYPYENRLRQTQTRFDLRFKIRKSRKALVSKAGYFDEWLVKRILFSCCLRQHLTLEMFVAKLVLKMALVSA